MSFNDTEYRRTRRESDPAYAEKRRQASREWKRRHLAKLKSIVEAAKNKPCVDCGRQYHPCCMEFDHVRGTKKFGLAKAARLGRTVEEVEAEIAKCEIRCVICHRLRHLT